MKTSIILPTHNQLSCTQQCIESIRQHTAEQQYELIIVDYQSSDGTLEWLTQQGNIKIVSQQSAFSLPEAYNRGIAAAEGDQILLLKNDVIVTEGWLDNLSRCLNSQEKIGAVGPVTNYCGNYQAVSVGYQDLSQLQAFARLYHQSNLGQWEERLKLVGFCLLLKKTVIDQIGLLDERFSPAGFEDDDFSLRIRLSGYKLMVCRDTFVHHSGIIQYIPAAENRSKFITKWGFDPTYSALVRYDIINLMGKPKDQPIRVLDIGCACGGTLLQIKNLYPQAELAGIEFNEKTALSARQFAEVIAADIEKAVLPYPKEHFDYIILADVLEHLKDPWQALYILRAYLKAGGQVLASIPNVMHFTVIRDLLHGNWPYVEAGILDKTHLRFFTKHEIEKMFSGAQYGLRQYQSIVIYESAEDTAFIQKLTALSGNSQLAEQFRAYQYLVKADKEAIAVPVKPTLKLQSLIFLLRRIEQRIDAEGSMKNLIKYLTDDYITPGQIAQAIKLGLVRQQEILLSVTVGCFQNGLYQQATILLQQAEHFNMTGSSAGLQLLRNVLNRQMHWQKE